MCTNAQASVRAHPHTSKYCERELCGSAPYPALSQTDAMEKAVAVGWLSWLSWLTWVHNPDFQQSFQKTCARLFVFKTLTRRSGSAIFKHYNQTRVVIVEYLTMKSGSFIIKVVIMFKYSRSRPPRHVFENKQTRTRFLKTLLKVPNIAIIMYNIE